MERSQNPFGLHSVTPYLIMDDVPRMIDFLAQVFGAELRGDIRYRNDRSVEHAEVMIGRSVLMLGTPLDNIGPTNVSLYVYVEDCDSSFSKALDLGAISISKPANYPHGDRYGGVKDFAGNLWWIVTHVGKRE